MNDETGTDQSENQYEYLNSNNPLIRQGYNLRERMNIYAGMTIGALAPIVGMKYFLTGFQNHGVGPELLAWGISLAINMSPLLGKGVPIPVYGSVLGGALSMYGAEGLKRKRLGEEPLFGHLERMSEGFDRRNDNTGYGSDNSMIIERNVVSGGDENE